MKEVDYLSLMGSFFLDLLPPATEQAFRLLAGLDYPIPDQRTFRERLKLAGGDAEASRLLASLFEPADFGMDTAQSAFEKFSKRSRHLNLPGVPLPRASLQLLADVVTAGGLTISGTDVMLRSAGGSIDVRCPCSATGQCDIVIVGNVLTCTQGSCKGTCDLVVTVPAVALMGRAAALG